MDLKKIKIVLGREFSIRVKKKSFIITTIVTPILFAAMMLIPSLIMIYGSDNEVKNIMIVDKSGIVANTLTNTNSIKYIINNEGCVDSLKNQFSDLNIYALVSISSLDSSNNVSVVAISQKQMNMDIENGIKKDVDKAVEGYKLTRYNISDLDTILEDVKSDVKVDTYTIGKDGKEKKSVVEISMALSYIMSFFIYIFVLMFGNMVMRSVIDEKSNRIVEVIVSSVKPFDLMIGKILGVACVAITQFVIWIVFTLVLVFGFQAVVGQDFIKEKLGAGTEQMAVPGVNTDQIATTMADSSEMGGILSALSQIDFPYILGCFFIYFVLGYLLYAAMFAAIGSAVDNEADTQQLVMPITAPMIIGLFIMIHTFQHPDSALSFWASIIPFTSPMVMLARIPFEGGVPTWELALSIGLLLLTFLITVYIAGKIYRVGILMYGKKASWKDLMKWIKF